MRDENKAGQSVVELTFLHSCSALLEDEHVPDDCPQCSSSGEPRPVT